MSRKRRRKRPQQHQQPIQAGMEIGAVPGHLGEVQVPGNPRIVPGVAAITEKGMVLALIMNWRENETVSARNGKERTGTEIETGTERETGRETEIDDVPELQTETQNAGGAEAGNDAGVAAPAETKERREKTEIKTERQRVRESVVARKTGSTIKIERGQKTRGVKERERSGGTRMIRRRKNTGKKREVNAREAEAETANTKLRDLARNAPALAAGAGRKPGKRRTGSGNAAIVRIANTSAVAAKSDRTVGNPAMNEYMQDKSAPVLNLENEQTVFEQILPDPSLSSPLSLSLSPSATLFRSLSYYFVFFPFNPLVKRQKPGFFFCTVIHHLCRY